MQGFPREKGKHEFRRSGEQVRPVFAASAAPRIDFKEALTILWLRKWSILLLSAAMLALAVGISVRSTPLYRAEASVLVSPINVSTTGNAPPPAPNLATEEEIVSSVAVARLVATDLGLQTDPRSLLQDLSVSSPSATEILELEYVHPDPAEAQTLAQAFAEAYLEYRRQTASEALTATADTIDEELNTLAEQEQRLEGQLEGLDEDDELRSQIESQLSLVRTTILQRELERVSLSNPGNVGTIVQPASIPATPFRPNHLLNGSFGLAAGLALGIGLAFARDRLSGRLRSQEEIEAQLGAPVLGSIPQVATGRVASRSAAGEAYRVLRTNLLASAARDGVKSVLVTSSANKDGKTTTSANLGIALAQADKRVILVSADLRRPRLHEFFRLPRGPGLTEVLTGRKELTNTPGSFDASIVPRIDNLRVIASGASVSNPAELLASNAMTNLLAELQAAFDLVILDAPPLLPVSDAAALAPLVDGVLFVVGPKGTTLTSIASSRKQIENVGGRLIGAVLNDLGPGMVRSYGY